MLRANVVSRVLREAGFRPLPSGTSRMREGLRVSQSGTEVRVTADLDSWRAAARLADDAADALIGRYDLDWASKQAFYVSARER